MRRLLRKPLAVCCIVFLLLIVAIAIVAPIVLPHVATENAGDLSATLKGPASAHLLGTDSLGRDVASRLLVGTRVTLIGVAEALAVMLILGVPLGLLAGYFGGWTDRIVSAFADITFSMPAIIIVLVVLSVFPQNMHAAMLAFGIIGAPSLMRVVRSATMPVREESYIAAAKISGSSNRFIIFRHVLPRVSGPIIVQASLLAAQVLLIQTGLAFLSLVVAAPAPSWGGMVADGMHDIVLQPWLIWPPGLAITLTVLSLGLLGDAVRDVNSETWSRAANQSRSRGARRSSPHSRPTASTDLPDQPNRLLAVQNLRVSFGSPAGRVTAVDGVSLDVGTGEVVGIVGETGSGKTATVTAILGLLGGDGQVDAGRIMLGGRDLSAGGERALNAIRGREIGFVAQDPMVSLNPAFRVGWQLSEVVRRHHRLSRAAARHRVFELLDRVHLPDPAAVARRYPHELSGGMIQRVAIARALAGEPRLLIADEPTTALDVTVQAEILDLLRDLQSSRAMAILLVTHDWGVVADLCDRAVVMYAGQVVEDAPVESIFKAPRHPYTAALLASNPHSAPGADKLPVIAGNVPALGQWPEGCRFHPRCRLADSQCWTQPIQLEVVGPDRRTRCIHHDHLW